MKFKKENIYLLSLSGFMLLFGIVVWAGAKKSEKVKNLLPDYKQEWLFMKTNGTGVFPEGLQQSWYDQSRKLRRSGESAIYNIKEIGPYNVSGRIRGIIIDNANENHYLAAGVSGGLWSSFDKGVSWNPINEHEVTLNVSCIDQSKSNPAIFYYGTGEGAANSVGFDGDGIFKSTDSGKTFSKLMSTDNANFSRSWKLKVDPTDENLVYVGTDNKGLWVTRDGGANWTKAFNTSSEINDVDIMPDRKVFFTVKGGGIYFSDDLGLTFSKINSTAFPSSFGRVEFAYCQGAYQYIYAVYSTAHSGYDGLIEGVYKSQDTGKTWTRMTSPSASAVRASFTWYCKIMEVHPTDPNKIYLAAVSPGYSLDGGNSWTNAADPHADYHSVALNPHNIDEIIVGNDGGAHVYNWNNLKTSVSKVNTLNITQFYHGSYHPTENSFSGGTQDNGTRFSLNESKNFARILGGDGAFTHNAQDIPNLVYASSQNGNIRRLTISNGFASSTDNILNELDADNNGTIDEGARFINPFWMNYNNGSQLFFVTNRGLWRTNNAGENWEKITANLSNLYAVGIGSEKDPTIYFGGSGSLYKLENGGTSTNTFSPVNLRGRIPSLSGQFVGCIRVHPTNTNTVYYSLSNVGSSSRLYVVTNAGTDSLALEALGDNLPTNLPINSFDYDPLDPDSTFVVGTDYGLYSTTDRGATWEKHLEVPNVSVVTVQTRKTDGKVFIYTHGRGAFIADMKSNQRVSIASTQPKIKLLLYPNPSADFIAIKGISKGIYTIFTPAGKRIRAASFIENEQIEIGSLPNGNYIVQVKNGTFKQSLSWVKQ